MERTKLRAILFADLQQFSRLTAADELTTIDFVTRCFALFQELCPEYGGVFVKNTGDGVLILFDSALSAVEYAMTMQVRMAEAGAGTVSGRFRIGLHMGEVRLRGGDVFGHAVNLAARIESQAEPGGVCVTEEVYQAARSNSDYGFHFGGRVALKNMPEPVSIYHVVAGEVGAQRRRQTSHLAVAVFDGLTLATERGDPVTLRSRKAQALIGYLALAGRRQESQDRVAALIWPDRPLAEARKALAGCAAAVDRATASGDAACVVRRGGMIGLDPARTEIDLAQVIDNLDKGKIDSLLLDRADWPRAILRGLETASPLFAAWLEVARHSQRSKASAALEQMLERFAPAEPAVRQAASALLLLEPSHEGAAQALIRHHMALGNAPAAIAVYEALRKVLRKRYRLAPSPATAALLRPAEAAPAMEEAPAPRRGGAPRVAVGAFKPHRDDLGAAVSGFRADLIANLSKFREFAIVETTEEADASGFDYLLTAVSAGGEGEVELFVTLAEPAARRVVWSHAFALSLADWTETQKRLVGKIAASLQIYLSQDRLARALQQRGGALPAYDAWLRGEHLLTRWTAAADDEATRLFEHAIAEDPNFAAAYASLASVHTSRHLVRPGARLDPAGTRRALELAQKAVAADPLDARNHLVVGWAAAMAQRFDQSEVHYELSAELNPNSPTTLVSAALGLAFMGNGAEARRLVTRATQLTPMFLDYQWSHVAAVQVLGGDLEAALRSAERSNDVIRDTPGWRAAALLALGRREEAAAALSALCEAVAPVWEGEAPATPATVLDWFLAAFPIRRPEDRAPLAALHTLL
jgi:class 3 adenylate cyclase/DNA-binding SARP family transcriptional activator